MVICLVALSTFVCNGAADTDVRIPPTFVETSPKDVILKAGVPTVLPCVAFGVPAVDRYEWTKNGLPLDLNNPNIVRDQNVGTITITVQDARDEGYYRCLATNTWGKAVSDNSVAVLAMINPLPQVPSHVTTATEGDPLQLPCTQTKSAPNITYFWSTVGSTNDPKDVLISISSRISISDMGGLYFAYTIPEDNQNNRIYKCNLKNSELDVTMGGSYTTLKINSRPIDSVAVVQKYVSPLLLTAIKGKSFSFRCIFSGKPSPTISWQRQSGTWDASRYEQKDFDTRLNIKQVAESDADTYICKGSNSAGSDVSYSMTLAVKVIPEFQDNDMPKDVNATEGGSVSISCRTYAVPQATVQWFKNGEPLQANQKQQLSADKLTLTIVDLCRDSAVCGTPDLMVISCNASNAYGYAYASGFVNVLKKTTSQPLPTSVTLEPPTPEDLTCEGSSDTSTPVNIDWYFNGYLIANESGKYEVYKNPGSTLLRIHSGEKALTTKVGGNYTCVVTNGYSSSVQSVDVKLPPGVVDDVASASFPWWIILVIIAAILFIVLIFLLCYHCIQKYKGDVYQVDKSEHENGNNPEKELLNAGFQGYTRPEETDAPAVLKSSRGSLGSSATLSNEPFERGTAPYWSDETA